MATTATVALTTVTPPANAPSGSTLDEEAAKKKNTDCVYFLASPLTCKKGEDCEFRHSESARLNPRDCWYWVGGNCLNRDCSFRHPPLETRGTAPAHPPPSQPKKPVPCFFFSQGCCVKGSKCQYLHGQKEQHENSNSGAMVYRLDANNRSKPDTDGEARKEPERKKENVYRLQDDAKKAKPVSRETSEGASDSQSEQQQQLPFRRKQHKENAYTWNRKEQTPQKQSVKQDQAEKSKPSSADRKRLALQKEDKSQQQEGSEPKGKRKLEVGDSIVEQDEARRKLANGAAAGVSSSLEGGQRDDDGLEGSIEVPADEETRQGTQSGPSDEDEDFARKLGTL